MFKAEGNAATCQSWGSVTWKAIHYNLTADNPASLTDTANYSGHWLKDSPNNPNPITHNSKFITHNSKPHGNNL